MFGAGARAGALRAHARTGILVVGPLDLLHLLEDEQVVAVAATVAAVAHCRIQFTVLLRVPTVQYVGTLTPLKFSPFFFLTPSPKREQENAKGCLKPALSKTT